METPAFRIVLCAFVLFLPRALAQDKPKPHVAVAAIAARPDDVSSIEAIVKTDYECISGGVGVARQWARDFTLYDPFARSFVPSKDEKTGALVIYHPTQQEYADESDAQLVRDGVSERELAHKIYRYGNVATVFSSYEVRLASGKLFSSGVNIYQLYYAENRWWISSVSWDAENNINPIPPELMPKN
ncbi:MAG TPA: hypothetical protein VG033_06275 [Candidatus Acidoferrales bacterium]|jgi:hypothetical protein|nr:hypothetical protein [Candidatus Acidoferrales bacterium]